MPQDKKPRKNRYAPRTTWMDEPKSNNPFAGELVSAVAFGSQLDEMERKGASKEGLTQLSRKIRKLVDDRDQKPAPEVMPLADEESLMLARRRRTAKEASRRGRVSTMLTPGTRGMS